MEHGEDDVSNIFVINFAFKYNTLLSIFSAVRDDLMNGESQI